MLSQGADAAVSRGCVDCSVRRTDGLLMGTVKQILRFAEKLRLQPFGLKDVAADLRELLERAERRRFVLETPRRTIRIAGRTLVMGVINMTPDFSPTAGRSRAPGGGSSGRDADRRGGGIMAWEANPRGRVRSPLRE
jgi:dihydropteroate synthase